MSTDPLRIERRASQRFDFHLPVSMRLAGTDREAPGFTQDVSAGGTFLYTDYPLSEGDAVEVVMVMPGEITLGEGSRVRCRGRVTRVTLATAGSKSGVAIHFEGYEFLPEVAAAAAAAGDARRASALHDRSFEEEAGMSAHTFDPRNMTVI